MRADFKTLGTMLSYKSHKNCLYQTFFPIWLSIAGLLSAGLLTKPYQLKTVHDCPSYRYTVFWCDHISNMPSKQIVHTSKKNINHLERIQRTATRRVKGLRGLTYEGRLKAHKLQPLENRMLRNNLVLAHKILFNQIGLKTAQ